MGSNCSTEQEKIDTLNQTLASTEQQYQTLNQKVETARCFAAPGKDNETGKICTSHQDQGTCEKKSCTGIGDCPKRSQEKCIASDPNIEYKSQCSWSNGKCNGPSPSLFGTDYTTLKYGVGYIGRNNAFCWSIKNKEACTSPAKVPNSAQKCKVTPSSCEWRKPKLM